MKKHISFFFLGLTLIFTNNCEDRGEPSDIDVESEILKEMTAQRIPSLVACIIKGDEIAWESAFGYADIMDSRLATRQTVYNLESVTKLFIAVAVMQLWEKGMIDLDADINLYLPFEVRNPNFPDHKITPQMLLTHTSSLAWPKDEDKIPDFYFFFPPEEAPLISEWLPGYILPGGAQYRNAVWKDFPPGKQELYSNIGTSLLALIVERISGEDFRDFCRKNILEPLEMQNSTFTISNLNEEILATPYLNYSDPLPQFIYRHYPAANLKSSIEDFSHFVIAFLNFGEYQGKKILDRSTVEKMFVVQNPATGTSLLWSNCLGDCIGKQGGGAGFSTWAEWHFDSDRGMIIFSNTYNESVYPKGRIYELIRYQCNKY